MILQKMYLLSVILKDRPIFTWEFFLNRFDTLCLEAQLDLESSGDIACLQDLEASDKQSDTFLKKINRARFALARTDSVRSVSGSVYAKVPYRRAASVPMHLLAKTLPNHPHKDKDKSPYKRQQSAPQFRSRGSRFGLGIFGNYMFQGGNLREFTDEESNFAALLQRAMDLHGVDRETVHQLVTLLVKFMVYSNQEEVTENRNLNRAQNIVLRHLNVLLGYNQTEKAFSVPPYKLRYSAVFNAYISALPQVLDKNFSLGNIILPVTMALLQYCASPQRYASDYQPPNYSVWLLEPHIRRSWLMCLLVILYKYQYNTAPAAEIVQTLVRLAVNTVDAQIHRCKTNDDTFGPTSPFCPGPRSRSRDTSNVSTGDLENIEETETPPDKSPDLCQPLDTVTFNLSSNTSAHYRTVDSTRESTRTDENDINIESLSKVTPQLSNNSPPRAGSPLRTEGLDSIGRSTSPEPVRMRTKHVGSLSTPVVASPTEAAIQGREQQSQRIAEYNRDSWIIMDDDGEPRSLEQSIEEFMFTHQCGKTPAYTQSDGLQMGQGAISRTTMSPLHSPENTVDKKIVEQLHEFELHGETRRGLTADPVELTVPSAWGHEKPILGRPMSTVLEEVKEADEEEHDSGSRVSPNKSMDCEQQGETDEQTAMNKDDPEDESPVGSPGSERKAQSNHRQRKVRKTGLSTAELISELSSVSGRSTASSRKSRRSEMLGKTNPNAQKKQTTNMKFPNEQILIERCTQCHAALEQYDEETISLSIVCLATLIHREPSLAAPLLLDMLYATSRIASSTLYPWQTEVAGLIIPGNAVSVARQFIRCTLHHLAPNGILTQLFMTDLEDPDMLKTIAAALVDFSDLNCLTALQILLEGVNDTKSISPEQMGRLVENIAAYLDYISLEGNTATWNAILSHLDTFLRRWSTSFMSSCVMAPVLKIVTSILKMPSIASSKVILEPVSKILSHTIQNSTFKLQQIIDMSSLCARAFTKERDKLQLTRTVIFELTQALKFKSILPDENLLLLVQFVCLDAGGTLGPTNIVEELSGSNFQMFIQQQSTTSAAECMKPHLAECVEFVSDLHTINKVKNNMKGGSDNLNEDTLGSILKAGIAQYVALELTKGNNRDNRAINRYLPWLYHPPSAMQQGPREFIDCVGHIRLLSWLLLGSLTHTAITRGSANVVCLPLALECSIHIADHIMVIMTGFAEQSKASVLHMSSLFHAFILCQLWTMYCESYAAQQTPDCESYLCAHTTVMDFWGRVTPGILQLLSHSKVLAEMVNLHFLSLMEALQECSSTVLSKLFPMWTPLLHSYHSHLPGHVQVRLQMCQNWEPKVANKSDSAQLDGDILLKWLKRVQFKLGQIEVQSSAATQFYTV